MDFDFFAALSFVFLNAKLGGCLTAFRALFVRRNSVLSVELAVYRLPVAAAYRRKVVAIDHGCAGCDRACRSLSWVVLVADDAMLWRYFGGDHLQQVDCATVRDLAKVGS